MAQVKKRLTREESRALTQTRLLNSAARAFAHGGFAGAAVEDIAESAGFSRGAFYSNFKNKDELFLALLERTMQAQSAEAFDIAAQRASPAETVSRLRAYFANFGNADRDAALLMAEAQLYAIRTPRFRSRLAALFHRQYEQLLELVMAVYRQLPTADRAPAQHAALISVALLQGLTLRNLVDPQTFPDKMIAEALSLVFDSLVLAGDMQPAAAGALSRRPTGQGG
jgi:AcrR family transcriptional regulator